VRWTIVSLALLAAAPGRAADRVLAARLRPTDGGGQIHAALVHRPTAKYPYRLVTQALGIAPDAAPPPSSEAVADHVIVKLRRGAARADLARHAARSGARIRRDLHMPGFYLVAAPRPALDSVPRLLDTCTSATGIVAYAEPDFVFRLDDTVPNDPEYTNGALWGHAIIDCPAAWDLTTGTGGTVIAIIDTGVDYNHEDLAANMWRNPGETGVDSNGLARADNGVDDDGNGWVDDVYGWDFRNDDPDPMDGAGGDYASHGTRNAGHAAAVGNNGAGVVGVCWSARIMALKAFNTDGSASSTILDSFAYIATMRDRGVNVRVANASWGNYSYSASLEEAIQTIRRRGVLLSASAGNDSRDIDTHLRYPACYPLDNIVCAAATTQTDGKRASSNYGAVHVDLGAPGAAILSTATGDNYTTSDGTSRSAPFVAGAAALVWELFPQLNHRQVRRAILEGVDPVPALQSFTQTGGRLNARGALEAASGAIVRLTPLPGSGAVEIGWTSISNRTFDLLVATNLCATNWAPAAAGLTATPPLNTVTATPPARAAFYRVHTE